MRQILPLGIIAVILLAHGAAGAGAPQPPGSVSTKQTIDGPVMEGFQYEISTESSVYAAGQPVYIDVLLKNTTDASLNVLYPYQTEEALNVVVHDEQGKTVPLTANGSHGYLKPDFSSPYQPYLGPVREGDPLQPLAAHQALHYRILVSRLYDLSEQGTYLISVAQWVPRTRGAGVATLTCKSLDIRIEDDDNDILTPLGTNPGQIGGGPRFFIGQTF